MKLKVILLDDCETFCESMQCQAELLNRKGKHTLELKTVTRVEHFYAELGAGYDLAIIDWKLGYCETDGFRVAVEAINRFPDMVVIMESSDPRFKADIDSLIMKDKLNCADVYKKFLKLKQDRPHNILEIYLSGDIVKVI